MLGTTARTSFLLRNTEVSGLTQHNRSNIATIMWIGVSTFATGFLIWNLDNHLCDILTNWKESLGWPHAFILEGHGWWHLLTVGLATQILAHFSHFPQAVGSYFLLVGTTRTCVTDDSCCLLTPQFQICKFRLWILLMNPRGFRSRDLQDALHSRG